MSYKCGMDSRVLDVSNCFIHGDLEEDVYMEIPPGFSSEITKGRVCKLKEALYSLKQSSRAWFERFHKAMSCFGYKQGNADHTVFIKHKHKRITMLIVL